MPPNDPVGHGADVVLGELTDQGVGCLPSSLGVQNGSPTWKVRR